MIKIKKLLLFLLGKSLAPDGLDLRCYVEDNGDVNRYVSYTYTCPVCGYHFITETEYLSCCNCGFSIKQNMTILSYFYLFGIYNTISTSYF